MRGTEGETVANANRAQAIDWFHDNTRSLIAERDAPTDHVAPAPEARDATATAAWIARALAGSVPIPAPIAAQVAHCVQASKTIWCRV